MIPNRMLRKLGVALASALVCFVGINLAVINLVPVLHHLTVRVEVLTDDSSQPVQGATVGWAGIPPYLAPRSCGTTDRLGTLEISETIQENPVWMRPMIGTFEFHDRILEVVADGFRSEHIPLIDALPGVSYADPTGQVRVRLRPN